jgi:hypothetical protein
MAVPTISIIGDSTIPFALVGSPQRSIGTIIPDIVTREVHTDQTVITEYPVEVGAAANDHAYVQPSRLEMRCRFSNSTAQSEGYVQLVYEEFLALQAQLMPFNVTTGKRNYQNMMIEGLIVNTDEFTEFVLDITVLLKQLIITSSSNTTTTSANQSPSAADQGAPQQTASEMSLGTQSLSSTAGAPSFSQSTSIDFNNAPTTGFVGFGGAPDTFSFTPPAND